MIPFTDRIRCPATGDPDWRGEAPKTQAAIRDPAFQTERLNVFQVAVAPDHDLDWKVLFLAFRTDEEVPHPVSTVTVWMKFPQGPWVEWAETCEEHRRQGLMLELLLAIEKHLGVELVADGATPAGTALLDKWEAVSEAPK